MKFCIQNIIIELEHLKNHMLNMMIMVDRLKELITLIMAIRKIIQTLTLISMSIIKHTRRDEIK